MKKQIKGILILVGIVTLCCLIMIGSSYLYLEFSLNSAEADGTDSSIPYAAPLPDSAGLLVTLPEGSEYLVYLNFSEDYISIANTDNINKDEYDNFYKIEAEYRFFANMIDRLGGIELYDSGETLRYTGTQILEKIRESSNNKEFVKEVIRKFFYNVTQVGITKEDFVYLIENTKTDLTVPDCYYWPPYIGKIAKNIRFED